MNHRVGIATLLLASLTVAVLLLSVPGSVREALERGEFYVFSAALFEDLPKRLTGPGRFRFILQPLVAIILGIRSGIADARLGRPTYPFGALFDRRAQSEPLKGSFNGLVNLLLMGILLDSLSQWFILGASYPGAALVVGPVLVATPYGISRALANRCVRQRRG